MNETEQDLGRPIYHLQTMLRFLSQTDNRILPVIPDGIYGANTYASVRSFQEIYALPPTGAVDLATWTTIVSQYNAAVRSSQPSGQMHLVQAMLVAVSEQYPEITAPAVTGKNNTETEAGLRYIQTAANLPQDGSPTPETQKALYALYKSIS